MQYVLHVLVTLLGRFWRMIAARLRGSILSAREMSFRFI
jgi:hypothetical protein